MSERDDATFQGMAREIEDDLSRRYGELLPSSVLVRVLGYPSPQAYRKALHLGRLPIHAFRIPQRRGHFALAKDVALWMASLRLPAAAKENTM